MSLCFSQLKPYVDVTVRERLKKGIAYGKQEPLAPLFGCTLREDKNWGLVESYRSYEQQIGLSGRPDLLGLGYIATFAKLRSLRLVSQPYVTVCGLRYLPRITNLDVTVRDCWTVHPGTRAIFYTEEKRGDFRHIDTLRFEASMSSVECNVNSYVALLSSFLVGLPNLRHLTLFGKLDPCGVDMLTVWTRKSAKPFRPTYHNLVS
ncbi:hypothetical protein EJ02DRAFT_44729 [Clathrospora elynae]|uniref:Uncharacterized protein n=1 Tax=Clathrospora elynae TaxID=706981 RepID=A0A6A5SYF9_9PLEO|nr:hypothetical protein EJ02DRAFT_44729 [Clathrospora elynae]